MTEKKVLMSPEALVQALRHIHALILAEEHIFEDTTKLRELLRSSEVALTDGEEQYMVIDSLRREIQTLKKLVYKDELTGVLNRRGVHEEFEGFFSEALFSKEHKELRKGVIINDFSIIYFDLDDFKSINDTFGHDEGDRVLKHFAQELKKSARTIDAVGRLGGEEFVMGLLGASEEEAFEKAELMRKSIEENLVMGDRTVTASIGVASLKASHAKTLEELITASDRAMYEAKTKRGKNTVVRYSELTHS